ncbi:MAG TPA: D-hexose-6-phosphate mutarotase [Candidatus Acidoferrales bacterium]|jgi:glucose-6-phosphate 1-epimerase|nr:D-hexose-6-phosphate mutarotase [Candidatus Acidoferrales bacterium]
MSNSIEQLRRHEIPGRVAVVAGNGGLAKIVVTSKASTAEIYPHGAHLTHFQKNGEQPLIFMSRKSYFAPGKPIRGGVPICFPWFGNRDGEPSHGFARIAEWQVVKTAAAPDGTVTVQFALAPQPGQAAWNALRTEFTVTVGDTLTMELTANSEACDGGLEIENCLHTHFQVGDISAVNIDGLEGAHYLDNAAGGNGERKTQTENPLLITKETNRLYLDTTGAVEIHDKNFKRTIRMEKSGSNSTVVWNPWTTQKLPDDFDPAEHQHMVCVESGNVKANKISLAPGDSTTLKVVLSSRPLK